MDETLRQLFQRLESGDHVRVPTLDFRKCRWCAKSVGLCAGCAHNQEVINELKGQIQDLQARVKGHD